MKTLADQVIQRKEKAVVWVLFPAQQVLIVKLLRLLGIDAEALNQGLNYVERRGLIKRFQNEAKRCIVLVCSASFLCSQPAIQSASYPVSQLFNQPAPSAASQLSSQPAIQPVNFLFEPADSTTSQLPLFEPAGSAISRLPSLISWFNNQPVCEFFLFEPADSNSLLASF